MAQPLIPKTQLGNPSVVATPPKVAPDPGPQAPVIPTDQLNAAANTVLSQLPAYIAEQIRETAAIYVRIPLWAMVAGTLLKSYENGDLHSPLLDPSWGRDFASVGIDPTNREYICAREACKKPFQPKRYKQRFCSTECGALAQADLDATAAADYAAKKAKERAERFSLTQLAR